VSAVVQYGRRLPRNLVSQATICIISSLQRFQVLQESDSKDNHAAPGLSSITHRHTQTLRLFVGQSKSGAGPDRVHTIRPFITRWRRHTVWHFPQERRGPEQRQKLTSNHLPQYRLWLQRSTIRHATVTRRDGSIRLGTTFAASTHLGTLDISARVPVRKRRFQNEKRLATHVSALLHLLSDRRVEALCPSC
jgi:hypothetical protein